MALTPAGGVPISPTFESNDYFLAEVDGNTRRVASVASGKGYASFAQFIADTRTFTAGTTLTIPSIGAIYAATDGVGTLGQANAGGQAFDLLNVKVRPEMYGDIVDGVDATGVLMAMADHARARGFLHCTLTAGKTYAYIKNSFLANIKVIHIDANGANFINTLGTAADPGFVVNAEGLVFYSAFFTNGPENYNGSLTPYEEGQLVDTVAAGASTFDVAVADGVPTFAAGDTVLLYGFDAQGDNNFPPCALEFERAVVTDVTGQTVTVSRPLVRSYRDDWAEINSNPPVDGGVTNGPARVISLTRGVDDFEEVESLYIENLNILSNPAWTHATATENRNGRLTVGGFCNANLVNVTVGGGCYIGQGDNLEWDGGRVFADLSPDKLLDTVKLKNMRADKISEGIGTRFIYGENLTVTTSISLGALEAIRFTDCDLPFNDGTTGGAMTAGNFTPVLDIIGGRMRVEASAKKYFTTPNEQSFAFTAVSETVLSVPLTTYQSNDMGRNLRVGTMLTNDGQPAFRVGELPYVSGTDVLVPGFTVGPFTSAVTLLAFPALSYGKVNVTAAIESPYEQSIRPFTTSTLSTPRYLKFIGLGFTEDSFELSSEQLPANLIEESGSCFGSMGGLWRPSSVSIDLHEPYTGSDPAPFIIVRENNQTNATYMTISALTAGFRRVSLNGNTAALGTDTLPTFPTGLFESWRVAPSPAYTDIDRAKAPKWTLKIEGWRKRGGIWQ